MKYITLMSMWRMLWLCRNWTPSRTCLSSLTVTCSSTRPSVSMNSNSSPPLTLTHTNIIIITRQQSEQTHSDRAPDNPVTLSLDLLTKGSMFGVNKSSRSPFRAQKKQTDKQNRHTLHPTHAVATELQSNWITKAHLENRLLKWISYYCYMTTTTTTKTTILRLSGFCPGQPGWAGTRRNTHLLTPIVVINRPFSNRKRSQTDAYSNRYKRGRYKILVTSVKWDTRDKREMAGDGR